MNENKNTGWKGSGYFIICYKSFEHSTVIVTQEPDRLILQNNKWD